jgi:hypothetical protein
MVLTVSFVLFPVTGLCCHRHQQVTTCRLDASVGASEPHDFAVRKARAFVFRAASRPPHPVPNVRDDRDTPLCGTGWRAYNFDLGNSRTGIFFRKGLDTTMAEPPVGQNVKRQ